MSSQQEQLEAILEEKFDIGVPGHSGSIPSQLQERIKQAITALIQEARLDEVRLARSVDSQLSSADIVNHLEERIKQLSGGSNNE